MIRKLSVLLLALTMAVSALAQTTDPTAALRQLSELQQTRMTEARNANKPVDFAALQAEILAKAKELIKDVDVKKVEPKDAYAWAQLFARAQQHADVCALAEAFIKGANPTDVQKFDAYMLMLSACTNLREAEMIAMTLPNVKPTDDNRAAMLASNGAFLFTAAIEEKQGAQAALDALKAIEANMPAFTDTSDQGKARAAQARFTLVDRRAELLETLGKRDEAIAALTAFTTTLEPTSPVLRTAKGTLTRMSMVGKPAPAVPSERGYGTYAGMESLKGKVVLLDFFAHWCGPCIASFPEMKELYSDLKGKGLEIIGFTTYYGYYKTENRQQRDMPKDTEFAKMKEFIDEHKLPWPVVYGERTVFDAYGVTGIPHVAVIDRKGVLRKIKIGYSPSTFAAFRKEIEALLNEK